MVKLLGKKVAGSMDYADLAFAGIAKYATERALSGIIGNGNIKSGAIKIAGGMGVKAFFGSGTIQNAVSLGMAIDGIEDVLTSVLGGGSIAGGAIGGGGSNW